MTNVDEYIKKIVAEEPGLIVDLITKYSDDYKIFEGNWHMICNELKVTPQFIVLLSRIPSQVENDNDKYVNNVCEELTKLGCCVRRQKEYIKCSICMKALLSKEMYDYLCSIGKDDLVPVHWDTKCSNCK